jgi:hypothetical protein
MSLIDSIVDNYHLLIEEYGTFRYYTFKIDFDDSSTKYFVYGTMLKESKETFFIEIQTPTSKIFKSYDVDNVSSLRTNIKDSIIKAKEYYQLAKPLLDIDYDIVEMKAISKKRFKTSVMNKVLNYKKLSHCYDKFIDYIFK